MFHTLGAVKNAFSVGEDEPELRLETERDLAQNVYYLITATEREKGNLVQHYGVRQEKISVVPCGIDTDLFSPGDKGTSRKGLGLNDDKLVLFVGRIEPLKGLDRLIRAMPYVQNGQRPRLLVVGGDEYSQHEVEQLKNLSSGLRIGDMVTFVGRVKHEELPRFYSAADVCVIPSYYESFGLVALEALACGTPVVATDVGDLSRILQGESGYVVKDGSPQGIARKINDVLSRAGSDEDAVHSTRASIARFSWSNIALEIVREFEAVLTSYHNGTH
jgi:D-inositol-3-phosphate glycosyltransferase